jgi:N-acetylmuramoyl-L-alanine amidase
MLTDPDRDVHRSRHRPDGARARRRRLARLGIGAGALLLVPLAVRLVTDHVALAHLADHSPAAPNRSVGEGEPRSDDTAAAAAAAVALDPTLAPGACTALVPLRGNRHRTVFLDAGHGGPDPGAVGAVVGGRPVAEKEATLPVALRAARLLRETGYRVVLSRTEDSAVARLGPGGGGPLTVEQAHADHMARVHCANLAGAAVLVSVHFNAFGDPSEGGATAVYDPSRPFAADNQRLATGLQRDIVASLAGHGWRVADRGIDSDAGTGGPALTEQGAAYGHLIILGPAAAGYVTEPTGMPGALVEPLFVTDPAEAAIATNPRGQDAIAEGIAQAVADFDQGRLSARAPPPEPRAAAPGSRHATTTRGYHPRGYNPEHWPVRNPTTVFGRPSLVGGGVLPVQARNPNTRFASISVAAAFSGGTGIEVVLPLTVSGPTIRFPPTSTNPVLPATRTGPTTVLPRQGGLPSSPASPATTTPLTPETATKPATSLAHSRSPVPPVTVSGPAMEVPSASSAPAPATVTGPNTCVPGARQVGWRTSSGPMCTPLRSTQPTVTVTGGDVDPAQLASPPYCAVNVCDPPDNPFTVRLAAPEPFNGTVPTGVAPSKNVTVPVGVTPAEQVTVADNVTG